MVRFSAVSLRCWLKLLKWWSPSPTQMDRGRRGTLCLPQSHRIRSRNRQRPNLRRYFSVLQSHWYLFVEICLCFDNVGCIYRSATRLWKNLVLDPWVSNVRMSVRTSVRPSTKSFFNFNEIWYEDRGRWLMHDGMQHDPIQGQGHEPLKVWK